MKTIGVQFCTGLFLVLSSCLTSSPELSGKSQHPDILLYSQDFEEGSLDGWKLRDGWEVVEEGGNHLLRGNEHAFAMLPAVSVSDISLRFNVRLDSDSSLHANVRQGQGNIPRYFIGIGQNHLHISKQTGPDDFHGDLARGYGIGEGWHQVSITAVDDTVTVFVDGEEAARYVDGDPSRAWGMSFECLPESTVYIDDVEVYGQEQPEELTWVRTGGPLGGMGYDIRMNPENPDIMYVTDAESGVFKSTDGGETWRAINEGILTRTGSTGDLIPIFCLSLDPSDPDVLWIGTQGQSGVYRSADGGGNWELLTSGIEERDLTFRGISVHPSNPDIVFAGAEVPSREWAGRPVPGREFDRVKGVVYKTTDGGRNWRRVWFGDNLVRYILIDPRDPDIVFASTGIFDREAANADHTIAEPGGVGILKSTDGGESWFSANRGLESLYIGSLVMHPENPDILMAGAGVITYSEGSGVYLSTDGGSHWTKTLDHFIESVEFAPSNPDIAYAGDTDTMYRSNDGGWSWELSIPNLPAWWGDEGIPVGHPIDISVDPRNPDRLFVNAYGGGAFLSTNGGSTWKDASKGYTGAQVRDIEIFPGSDSRIIAAARSGIFISDNRGDDWEGRATGKYRFLDWHTVAVHPGNPEIILSELTCERTVVRSVDGGLTWMEVARLPNKMGWGAIEWSPSDSTIAYAGSTGYNSCGSFSPGHLAGGILKSVDSGRSWQESNSNGTGNLSVLSISVHPENPNDVFFSSDGKGLWHTVNSGKEWDNVGETVFGEQRVTFVAHHPDSPDILFAGLQHGGLRISLDGGRRWDITGYGINPEAIVNDMAFDPTNPEVVYLADLNGGVYRSTDGGRVWRPINDGLLVRAVNALALTGNGKHLYAASEGGGVFRLDLE